MSLLRAIAQHYAANASGKIVPASRFTEGHRSQLDELPAIVYQRSSETEDAHQQGSGFAQMSVSMTCFGETPAQADRIRDELRDLFHLLAGATIGSGADATLVKFCELESTVDYSNYPQDEGADFENASTCYFVFTYAPKAPTH